MSADQVNMMNKFLRIGRIALSAAWAFSISAGAADAGPAPRPNIVVIVADDLGFSDLGAFGGEIRTPNLDALAKSGLRLTDFHAAPSCSPTRSMLLSGTDNHTAGVGAMAEVSSMLGRGEPGWGYEGVLTRRVATLAERLEEADYFTVMSGKWHLGLQPEQDPHARGFQKSFALLQGAGNHFGGGFGPDTSPFLRATYTEDGEVTSLPKNFYSSDLFTTKLLDQLRDRPRDKPFFAYLAFTAPHSPLQAPPQDIARYRGRYDKGWAALRAERLERMKALGLVARDVIPAPLVPDASAWGTLTPQQRQIEARKMEIYAAMVDRLDQNVGRLIAALKRSGADKNTILLFMSDNGPAAEGEALFSKMAGMAAYFESRDRSYTAMGGKNSADFYGPYWAQAGSAPSRLYKGMVTEGGTRVAAFITYPGFARQGAISPSLASVMDVVPTLLDAAQVRPAKTVGGREVAPIRGRSMLPYLHGESDMVHSPDEAISFELHGQRAVRQGQWKLVWLPKPVGGAKWALYDLSSDPAEQHDLSDRFPDRYRMLVTAWGEFAKEVHIDESAAAF